ncbi:MAG: ABC transporter ATP-binding protein [Nitrospinae bacterium]|nr:ABC transporter ATP-binding protein [Nitrospinota bacterium]
MSDAIIAENLSKKYVLAHKAKDTYTTLRDEIARKFASVGKKLIRPHGDGSAGGDYPAKEEFWALKDVEFNIGQGERVGLIGRNGAGKSTLLKILTRITEPTTGRITLKGRVASLLEVGTGFHPELTGRENIFLNGAILGMRKGEISKKFDEIVAFAGVERFLDTPVKRYSSGMYVRLAFAVAAHLEPEILLVDEVLAVGDAEFQKKCIGKMEGISKEGRTLVFVSHNLSTVSTLCGKGILLDAGEVKYFGEIDDAITHYRTKILSAGVSTLKKVKPEGPLEIKSVTILDGGGSPASVVRSGEPMKVVFEYELAEGRDGVVDFHFIMENEDQVKVFCCTTQHAGEKFQVKPGRGRVTLTIPRLPLIGGAYQYHFSGFVDGVRSHLFLNFGELVVAAGHFYSTGLTPQKKLGVCLVDHRWEITDTSGGGAR